MTELSQDPHEGNLAVILDYLIRLDAANQRNELVNKVRIFPQDVLQHLDCLCGDVCDLEAEEVLELRADRLGQVGQANDDCAEASDGAFGDFSTDVCHVLA